MSIFYRYKQRENKEKCNDLKYTYHLNHLNLYDDDEYERLNKKIKKNNEKLIRGLKSLINLTLTINYNTENFDFISYYIGENYIELIYYIEDNQIKDKIEKLQIDLNDCMNNQYQIYVSTHYNFIRSQQLVKFDINFERDQFSIINTKDVFDRALKSIVEPKFKCIVGITNDNEPLIANLNQQSNMIISGKEGCGKTNIAKQILLSLIAQYSRYELDLKIYDESKIEFDDFRLSKYVSDYITNNENMNDILNQLNDEVEYRLKLFNNLNVSHINNYNLHQLNQNKSIMKRLVIYIDECMNLSEQSMNIIDNISKIGYKIGVYFIVASGNISYNTANIIKLFDDNYWQYIMFNDLHYYKFKNQYHGLFKNLGKHEFIYYIPLNSESQIIRRGRGCNINNEIVNNIMTELSLK